MRVLLDECVPARLRREFVGHEIQTVPRAGWAGIKNGRLLQLVAESGNFDVFLTMDKHLTSQQKISSLPFAVVVLRAKSNSIEDARTHMPELLRRINEFKAGNVYVLTQPE
jgi:predicted nuclease of predicted toxin-antitoxin system